MSSIQEEDRGVRKSILTAIVFAGALFIAGLSQPASASVTLPAAPAQASQLLVKTAWVCGPYRCVWINGAAARRRAYARRHWGPPPRRGCYWYRNRWGAWKMRCP